MSRRWETYFVHSTAGDLQWNKIGKSKGQPVNGDGDKVAGLAFQSRLTTLSCDRFELESRNLELIEVILVEVELDDVDLNTQGVLMCWTTFSLTRTGISWHRTCWSRTCGRRTSFTRRKMQPSMKSERDVWFFCRLRFFVAKRECFFVAKTEFYTFLTSHSQVSESLKCSYTESVSKHNSLRVGV